MGTPGLQRGSIASCSQRCKETRPSQGGACARSCAPDVSDGSTKLCRWDGMAGARTGGGRGNGAWCPGGPACKGAQAAAAAAAAAGRAAAGLAAATAACGITWHAHAPPPIARPCRMRSRISRMGAPQPAVYEPTSKVGRALQGGEGGPAARGSAERCQGGSRAMRLSGGGRVLQLARAPPIMARPPAQPGTHPISAVDPACGGARGVRGQVAGVQRSTPHAAAGRADCPSLAACHPPAIKMMPSMRALVRPAVSPMCPKMSAPTGRAAIARPKHTCAGGGGRCAHHAQLPEGLPFVRSAPNPHHVGAPTQYIASLVGKNAFFRVPSRKL